MTEDSPKHDLLEMTVTLVAAHVGNNTTHKSDLPDLITTVHDTLKGLIPGAKVPEPEVIPPTPKVSIRQSIKPSYIACLECGSHQKMLRAHLRVKHGLTEAAYKEKWGLPNDYPMVSAEYAESRRKWAMESGLGNKRREAIAAEKAAAAGTPETDVGATVDTGTPAATAGPKPDALPVKAGKTRDAMVGKQVPAKVATKTAAKKTTAKKKPATAKKRAKTAEPAAAEAPALTLVADNA